MSKENLEKHELSWSTRPGRELAHRAWPIAVSTLSYSAMSLVGAAFVARVGAAEVAGVGLAATAHFAFLCFAIGALRGAKTLTAQALGAGRVADADRYLGVAVLMALGWGVVSIVLAEVAAPLLAAAAADVAQGGHASTYLRIRALAAPLVLVTVAMRETRWAEGDARLPMRATVAGNLINLGLDAVLILGLGWGVAGAALASVAGSAVECAVLAVPLRARLARAAWRPAYARALLAQGTPTGVQFLLEVGAFLALSVVVARMGELDGAAHQLVLQLTHVSFLPAHALAEAASVLVGRAIGAGRPDLVRPVAVRAMQLGGLYTAACTVGFALGATPMAQAMGAGDGPLLVVTRQLIWLAAAFLIADAANVIARGVLRGVGDAVHPAIVGVVTAWVVTPPLAAGLGLGLGWGVLGGWLGLTIEIVVGAALLWRRLLGEGWRSVAEVTRARTLAVGAAAAETDAESRKSNVLLSREVDPA
jgi:MATE family multidrug resistance protein